MRPWLLVTLSAVTTLIGSQTLNSMMVAHSNTACQCHTAEYALSGGGNGVVSTASQPPSRSSSPSSSPSAVVTPSMVPSPTAQPHRLQSTHECARVAAWGDVCVHRNACFDGSVWYHAGKHRWWHCTGSSGADGANRTRWHVTASAVQHRDDSVVGGVTWRWRSQSCGFGSYNALSDPCPLCRVAPCRP